MNRGLRALPYTVAILLAALLLAQPAYIFFLTLTRAGGSPQTHRLTFNTKGTTRFSGETPQEVSLAVSQALYPPQTDERPRVVVLVPEDDWRLGLAASPLLAAPLLGVLLFAEGAQLSPDVQAELQRLAPTGLADGAQVLLLGAGLANLAGEVAGLGLQPRAIAGGPAEVAAQVAGLRAALPGAAPQAALLVGSDDYRFSLPAGAWAAFSGDPVLFATMEGLPEPTQQALGALAGLPVYVVGREQDVPPAALTGLTAGRRVARIAGPDPFDHAVALAQFHDDTNDFGWGYDPEANPDGCHNYILANVHAWPDAVAGQGLASAGKWGPLLWTEAKAMPPPTAYFIWADKPDYFSTPAEGPFHHVWIVGGLGRISFDQQGLLDFAQEIDHYRTQGAGLSGLEGLWLGWLAVALAGAAGVVYDEWRYNRHLLPLVKLGWVLLVLLLGPFGILFYWLAYRRRTALLRDGRLTWQRPGWAQAMVGTGVAVGFAATSMMAISFLLTLYGLPLILMDGSLFWLGSPMTLLILLAYVGAFGLALFVFQTPLQMHMRRVGYVAALGPALVAVAVSMTAVTVGMMATMWWLHMGYLPMMPEDDEFMWFGVMYFSILIGFLLAWPFNRWLVRRGIKSGGM